MKIGFFTDGYLPQINGVAISVETSAKALKKLGHEVYIVAPKYPAYKDEKNVIRIPSLQLTKQPDYRLATFLPNRAIIAASRIDFDIIHGHSGGPITLLGWEVSRLKRVPFVVTYHTLWNQYTHYILRGKVIRPRMAEIASRIFGNLCDMLIVPTKKVEKELQDYGIDKPILVIPNGIETERFHNHEKGYLHQLLKLSPEKKILLYVGRIGKEKSIDFLIRSFKDIVSQDAQTVLVVVGDGTDSERKRLLQIADDCGVKERLYFTGFVKQHLIPKVYADGEIFLFSSTSETQGMVIIEAMASGLPVVSVYDDAYVELVKNGKTGYLVKGKEDAFAQAVNLLLQDDKKRKMMGTNAQKKAQDYSVLEIAKSLEKTYSDLIKKNSKNIDFPFRRLKKYLLQLE